MNTQITDLWLDAKVQRQMDKSVEKKLNMWEKHFHLQVLSAGQCNNNETHVIHK